MPLILKDPFFLEEQKCCYGSLLLCALLQHEESERCTNFSISSLCWQSGFVARCYVEPFA